MSDISDYAQRIPYYRARYAARRDDAIQQCRDYRRRNRKVIGLARKIGVPIPEARAILAREASIARPS